VTTQPTDCVIDGVAPISAQQQLVEALVNLMAQYPRLPEAYIAIHDTVGGSGWIDLQLDSALQFEQWREALEIQPADVDLKVYPSNQWMAGDTRHMGVRIHVTGFNVPVTGEQTTEPRDRSAVTA
jgi:hypothetical protein